MTQNRNNRTLRLSQLHWQKGMALVVSLILLITVTLVGLAGMRGTILQERMAGGSYDRETGFQAAEAALILGATDFTNNRQAWDLLIADNAGSLDCSNQSCPANPSGQIDNTLWEPVMAGNAENQFSAMDTDNPPQFVVQLLGACSSSGAGVGFTGTTDQNEGGPGGSQLNDQGTCYRITARALDPTAAINAERSQVLLQATYRM